MGQGHPPVQAPSEIEAEKLALPDCTQHVMDIVKNCEKLTDLGTDFLAVHANPLGHEPDSPDKGSITVEMVAKIPFHKLAPYGFVFMWVEKENLSAVCDAMMDQKFVYVENMTWVQMMPNNTMRGEGAVPPTIAPHHAHFPPRRPAVPRGRRRWNSGTSAPRTSRSTCSRPRPRAGASFPSTCTRLWRRSCRRAYKAGYKGRHCWSSGRNPARRRDGRADPRGGRKGQRKEVIPRTSERGGVKCGETIV